MSVNKRTDEQTTIYPYAGISSAIKRNELLKHTTTEVDFKVVTLTVRHKGYIMHDSTDAAFWKRQNTKQMSDHQRLGVEVAD